MALARGTGGRYYCLLCSRHVRTLGRSPGTGLYMVNLICKFQCAPDWSRLEHQCYTFATETVNGRQSVSQSITPGGSFGARRCHASGRARRFMGQASTQEMPSCPPGVTPNCLANIGTAELLLSESLCFLLVQSRTRSDNCVSCYRIGPPRARQSALAFSKSLFTCLQEVTCQYSVQ